ncbi:hypothetical protein JXB12_07785 [candidate division KSB1 bacterium]|nr:hypothetical protein [candidate division KSB1 bacterium]
MTLFKNKYRIESTRWQSWNYSSSGAYFITIVTKNRVRYFGSVRNGRMNLSELGSIAHQCFEQIPDHFPIAMVDEFVIMPDHVHAIIVIKKNISSSDISHTNNSEIDNGDIADRRDMIDDNRSTNPQRSTNPHQPDRARNRFGPQSQNLASIVRGYKTGVTKYARLNHIPFKWQSLYHDHVIRNNDEFMRIKYYIRNNPRNWTGL